MHLSAMDSPIENCQEISAEDIRLLEVLNIVNQLFPNFPSFLHCMPPTFRSSPSPCPHYDLFLSLPFSKAVK